MLTIKDYCDYDTCVALMELGYYYTSHYNWRSKDDYLPATAYWRVDMIPMIHLYDAQKWLRENLYLHITIFSSSQESWMYRIAKPHQKLEEGVYGEDFSSFEESLLEGIKESVKILKEE